MKHILGDMGDNCVESAEKILNELKNIKKELDPIQEGDMKTLSAFKPKYDKLLEVLEQSKELASCPISVLKVSDECEYKSPLEPLVLSEYAGIPSPDEPYTILDDIRRHGKNGRVEKIKKLVDDVVDRLEAYVRGAKECPLDYPDSDEDIDSMMAKLGLNPDEFLEGEEESDENS